MTLATLIAHLSPTRRREDRIARAMGRFLRAVEHREQINAREPRGGDSHAMTAWAEWNRTEAAPADRAIDEAADHLAQVLRVHLETRDPYVLRAWRRSYLRGALAEGDEQLLDVLASTDAR